MIVTCKVIEDLLPLYADGICSEDTKTVVEHHIAECDECRLKLEAMTSETIGNEKDGTEKPSPENPFKKLRRHYTRLVVCTLLICAAVIIPPALIFSLYIGDEIDKGISFSSIAVNRELKEFGNMFKRGEYRKALESVELYNQDGYTNAEISAFKDMFADDLEEYFKKYPIKKVRVAADDGKCESGYVHLYLDADKCKGTDIEPVLYIYFETRKTDIDSYVMTLGSYEVRMLPDYDYDRELNVSFPPLTLIPYSRTEDIFNKMNNKFNYMFMFMFYTDEYNSIGDQIHGEGIYKRDVISCVYAQRLKKLLTDYSYINCESEGMTYVREPALDFPNHFIQHDVLTFRTAEGNEFTVEFDTPILADFCITHLKNVSYSDNAPDDFRLRFEEIFVNDAPVYDQYQKQHLNDGKFYLNGSTESCYFEVKDGKIQLVIENERQARECYEAEMANTTNEAYRTQGYEDWYKSISDNWSEPKSYDVSPTSFGLYVIFNVSYDSDGIRSSYGMSISYSDSDNIMHNNCVFTRVD